MLLKCAMNKSFHVSVSPGKHQCMQSSCLFPPAADGWASARNSLIRVMSNIWNFEPLSALYRWPFTSRVSTFVPLLSIEKSCSTWTVETIKCEVLVWICQVWYVTQNLRFGYIPLLYITSIHINSIWIVQTAPDTQNTRRKSLPLLVLEAVSEDMSHLGPNRLLQNALVIVFERIE